MNRLALAVFAAATMLASSADAGPYLGLGVGTAPTLGESAMELAPASRSARLELGQRLGVLAVEGGVSGFSLASSTQEARSISVAGGGKLFFNLQGQLDAFVRGGVERTWLTGDRMSTLIGDGYYAGGGAELRLALPIGATSLWFDYTRHQATLVGEGLELEANTGVWSIGVTVGL